MNVVYLKGKLLFSLALVDLAQEAQGDLIKDMLADISQQRIHPSYIALIRGHCQRFLADTEGV